MDTAEQRKTYMEKLERDPHCILLNKHGFRGKFHVYEIRIGFATEPGKLTYTVAKQLLDPFSADRRGIQEIVKSEKHVRVQVTRDDLAAVYDFLNDLSIPLSRTAHAGIDGATYALQVGFAQNKTIVHWWSDNEPELKSLYKLRDRIISTVNRLVREQECLWRGKGASK